MNFVDEQNGVGVIHQLFQHCFQTLLKITAIFCARKQRAHVERIHLRLGEDVGDLAVNHTLGQTFGNRSFTDTSFTDQQWIIFTTTAKYLDHALDFVVAPDQGINLAVDGHLVQVQRKALQRATRLLAFRALGFSFFFLPAGGRDFGNAVRNEIHHVQPRHALLMKEINRVRIFFAVNRHQHIRTGDFFFTGRLHVQNRALDDALKTKCGLGIDLAIARNDGRVLLDKFGERFFQFVDFCRAGLQHFLRRWIFQQGEQQMLDRDELVALLSGFDKGHVETDFEFLRNHDLPFREQLPCNQLIFNYLLTTLSLLPTSMYNASGIQTITVPTLFQSSSIPQRNGC